MSTRSADVVAVRRRASSWLGRVRVGAASGGPQPGPCRPRRRDRRLGHQHSARRRRPAAGQRHRQGRAQRCITAEVPRCHGEKGAGKTERPAGRRAGHALTAQTPVQDRRQLLAVRDHAVRLHPPRDAVPRAAVADATTRCTRSRPICSHLNGIIGDDDVDERADAAEGEDAEPRQLHQRLPRPAQVTDRDALAFLPDRACRCDRRRVANASGNPESRRDR